MESASRPTETLRHLVGIEALVNQLLDLAVMRSLSSTLCLVLMLLSASVRADPGPDALIEQGLQLRRSGKPEEALEMFRRAHALAPSVRTFGQMGLVETSLKRWVDGENHLAMSLSNPDDAWVHKNRTFLDEALAICRQHVGELVVSGPAGVEVFVAGNSVGTLPTVPAVRLAEGSVTVTASAPGFKPFEQTTTISPGKRSTLAIAMTPVAPPSVAPLPPAPIVAPAETSGTAAPTITAPPTAKGESSGGSWHTWGGITLASAGAAAIAWGAVWVAIDGTTASNGLPYDTRTPGLVLLGVGAAAIAGGAVIFFTAPSTSDKVALGIAPGSVSLRARF